jgi:hypothetical protein
MKGLRQSGKVRNRISSIYHSGWPSYGGSRRQINGNQEGNFHIPDHKSVSPSARIITIVTVVPGRATANFVS